MDKKAIKIRTTLTGNLTSEYPDEVTTIMDAMMWQIYMDDGLYSFKLTAQSGAEHDG